MTTYPEFDVFAKGDVARDGQVIEVKDVRDAGEAPQEVLHLQGPDSRHSSTATDSQASYLTCSTTNFHNMFSTNTVTQYTDSRLFSTGTD